MASGFTQSLADELIAGVESTKENVNARGEETIKTVAQVTTEGPVSYTHLTLPTKA